MQVPPYPPPEARNCNAYTGHRRLGKTDMVFYFSPEGLDGFRHSLPDFDVQPLIDRL